MLKKILHNLKNPLNLFKKIVRLRVSAKKFSEQDKAYWESLKDVHKGKRGFVIGNGPSLEMADLDLLKNEISIASNKIYLAFKKTGWRPTYYTAADPVLWEKIKHEVHDFFDIVHIPTYLEKRNPENTKYWKSAHMGIFSQFSSDMSNITYSGQTITYENLQIAVHLGLNPIYIIGCDHNYPGEKNVTAGVAIKQGSEQSHFIKGYRKKGEIVLPASIVDMEMAYKAARKFCDINGILLFNATRGGRLEIFERADFDKVVQSVNNVFHLQSD